MGITREEEEIIRDQGTFYNLTPPGRAADVLTRSTGFATRKAGTITPPVGNGVSLDTIAPDPRLPLTGLDRRQYEYMMRRIERRAHFSALAFSVGSTVATLIRRQEDRLYLLIQNTDAANKIYLGIGYQPSSTTGIVLTAGTVYEPFQVPDNDIFVLGSAAGVTGVLLFAV